MEESYLIKAGRIAREVLDDETLRGRFEQAKGVCALGVKEAVDRIFIETANVGSFSLAYRNRRKG